MRPRVVPGMCRELRESQELAVMPGLPERASDTAGTYGRKQQYSAEHRFAQLIIIIVCM